MSDFGRKDLHSKAKEVMKPNPTKSTTRKTKESVTDAGDRISRGAIPDSKKSTSQSISDKFSRSHDRTVHGGTGQSVGDKVQGALGLNKKHHVGDTHSNRRT